jgi:hypothetical protein
MSSNPIPLLLLVFSFASVARAAEDLEACDAEICATPLAKGERAPFDGQLLTPKLAIKLGQRAEAFDLRLKLEVDHATKLAALDLTLEKRLREIDAAAASAREDALRRALEEERQRWYERPPFVAAASAALAVGLLFGAAHLIAVATP